MASAHLLPNYDEYFIGHRDRSAIAQRLGHAGLVTGGNTRAFAVQVPVRAILGTGIPAGRYFLAVAVQEEKRRIVLSAGDVTLGP